MKCLAAILLGVLFLAGPTYPQVSLDGTTAAKASSPRVAWDSPLPGTSLTQIIVDGTGGVVVIVDEIVVWLGSSGQVKFQAPGTDLRSVSRKGISYIDSSAVLRAVDKQGRQVPVPDSAAVLPIYPASGPANPNQVSDEDGFFVFYSSSDTLLLRRYEW